MNQTVLPIRTTASFVRLPRGGMLDEELAAAPDTALHGDQGSLTPAAGWPMASPVFNQGRNHAANPGEKRFRARSEQAGIAVK